MSDMLGNRREPAAGGPMGESEIASERPDCAPPVTKVQRERSFGRDGCPEILHQRDVRMPMQSAGAQCAPRTGDPKVKCNQHKAVPPCAQPGMQVALTEVTTEGQRNTRQEHTRREAGPQSQESRSRPFEIVRLPKVVRRNRSAFRILLIRWQCSMPLMGGFCYAGNCE
jgi:hypothetical protein